MFVWWGRFQCGWDSGALSFPVTSVAGFGMTYV